MLPPFTNKMFLDPELKEYVSHIRMTYSKCFDFVLRLNELAHQSIFDAKVIANDAQQLLLAALLQRAITAFQSTVILAERGLPMETQVMLRTLLEITFKIVAIAKDEEVARAFILEDEVHRRKFLNKFKLLSEPYQNGLDHGAMESLLDVTTKRIKDKDIKELKTQWFAQRAGLSDFYNSAYAVFSETVHANVRSLDKALNVDDRGSVTGFNYGFSDQDIEQHLLTASEALIFSLRAAFSLINVSTVEQIHAFHGEFNLLHAEITGET